VLWFVTNDRMLEFRVVLFGLGIRVA
jgi:hypothetical protein